MEFSLPRFSQFHLDWSQHLKNCMSILKKNEIKIRKENTGDLMYLKWNSYSEKQPLFQCFHAWRVNKVL